MARAPKSQRRAYGKGEVLMPPPPAPAEPLSSCLDQLRSSWRREGSLAAIWQDWPSLAGAQLAPHCRPLNLQGGILTVGASHPQWRQALLYSRPQLLAALRAAGHGIKELRIQQHHGQAKVELDSEASIWARHPSRIDVHGMDHCPRCGRPSPAGEIALWGHCGFCRRSEIAQVMPVAMDMPVEDNAREAQ